MAHHLAAITIEHIGNTWRICNNGICIEHRQEWQARVFYHQMIANAALLPHGPISNTVEL
jgi:hypothetical protein